MESEYQLGYENDPTIKNKIGNEKIFFSGKIEKKKFGFLGKFQGRNLLITNTALYIFKKTEIKQRKKIEDLKGVTYSRQSNEFVIHFNENNYDYLFKSENRNKIITILQSLYEKLKNEDLLFVAKIEKDLSKYVVTKKERKGNPYLFKMDNNDLTPIKDYLENEFGNKNNTNDDFEVIENQPNEEYDDKEQEQEKQKTQMIKITPPPLKPKQQKPPKPPKPEKESKVKVISGSSKGVPPPPSPPPPPPPPPVVAAPSKPSSSSKPVDLAAELASKKNNLKHVEVKEYVSPALQSPEEGGGGGSTNSMMAAIMAQRNKMKKPGAGSGVPATKPQPAKPKPGAFPKPSTNTTTAPKPITTTPKTTTTVPNPDSSNVNKINIPPKNTNSGTSLKPPAAKPPAKMGGGGGFGAKLAFLQARMGGPSGGGSSSTNNSSSSNHNSKEPSKPIVELCEGNTKKMDINKVIGNLEKEKKKQQAKASSKPVKVKVISNKGGGIPPPPPPPPPPPVK